MYLSRLELEARNPAVRRVMASPQFMHASVENCFLSHEGQLPERNEQNRILWRLDKLAGQPYLLLLSPERPDFSRFTQPENNERPSWLTKDYAPFLSKLREGQRWRFRLRGNAAHSESGKNGARGKVYAHVTITQQQNWLMKKSQVSGFILDKNKFMVTETGRLRFWRAGEPSPVTLGVADFEGELEIKAIDLFKQALTQGIGRAKAYGCGLLTLSPLL